jgi:type II secretory pathway pseudopilin PulG
MHPIPTPLRRPIHIRPLARHPLARQQAGLTLIELAVVMLILIGLATLVLPMTGGIVAKAEMSTSAATEAELFNQIQLYQAQKSGLPNGWDLLTDGGGALLNYLDNGGYVGAAIPSSNFGLFPAGSAYQSLAAAGITTGGVGIQGNEVTMDDGERALCSGAAPGATGVTPAVCGNVIDATAGTFKTLPTAITAATRLVTSADGIGQRVVSALGINSQLQGGTNTPNSLSCNGGDALAGNTCTPAGGGATYSAFVTSATTGPLNPYDGVIVLGVGQNSQMVGTVMQSAPMHFPDNATTAPDDVYARYLAAFAVDSTGTKAAKLIGIVYAMETGSWESIQTHVSDSYSGQ